MAVQWEECCGEYRSKRALYFRLHQEMQDTNIKMKGLQQVRELDTCIGLFLYLHNLQWRFRLPWHFKCYTDRY